jgi:hypothetical protein
VGVGGAGETLSAMDATALAQAMSSPLHPLLVAPDHRIHRPVLLRGEEHRQHIDIAGGRERPDDDDLRSGSHLRYTTWVRRSSLLSIETYVSLLITVRCLAENAARGEARMSGMRKFKKKRMSGMRSWVLGFI